MSVVPRIAALVLAGGGGSRLGGGKLLLPWRGKTILLHVLESVAEIRLTHPIVLVTGYDAAHVRRTVESDFAASETRLRIVENLDWRAGQSSSLRRGIGEIAASMDPVGLCGVMILLGDQPQIRPDTIARLARAHLDACSRDPAHPATVPTYEGRRGNPAIVSPSLFPQILELEGDIGARNILANLGDALLCVPVNDAGVVRDIDTPEEYASLAENP